MEGQNMNDNGNINVNVNDGDKAQKANSPTPSSEKAQKAAPVVVGAGEGSATVAEKRRRVRKGKKPVAESSGAGGSEAAAADPDHGLHNRTEKETSSEKAQKAAPLVVEVGKGSATVAEKRRRVRKGKKPVAESSGAGGGEAAAADPDHGLHNQTEKERRKQMKSKYDELLALLPHVPAKADKSAIVEEAFNFIKLSEQKLQSLEKQILERDQSQTPTSVGSNSSREAFIADQGSSAPHGSGQDNHQILTAGHPLSGAASYATTFKTFTTPNMVLNICGDMAQINICVPKRGGIFGVICFFLEKYMIQVLYATVSCDLYRAMFMIQAQASGGVDQMAVEDVFQLAMGELMMYISTIM